MASNRLRLYQARRSTAPAAATFLQQQQQQPGFTPTQPGDPDFSLSQTPSSQAQFPAAAAEKRLYENQTRAQNTLADAQAAGFDTSLPEYQQIAQVAEKGFLERAATLGEGIINFIDGGRQAVNLLFQDVAGGAAGPGQRDPGIKDYFDALWFGIDDDEQFQAETGLQPETGSYTLDLLGWDEAETWYGKTARGIGHFALDVAMDPLTYVTFGLSGLGRKVAKATANKFTDDVVRQIVPAFKAGTLNANSLSSPYARGVARNLKGITDEFVTKHLDSPTLQPDVQRQLKRFLTDKKGLDVPDDPWAMMQLVQENVVEMAIRNKTRDDVLAPLLRRDFANVSKDALEDLPKWAYGGARVSFPFTQRGLSRGWVIPGTQGVGKKFVGDHLRNVSSSLKSTVPGYNKLSKAMKSVAQNLDRDKGLLEGLARKDGGIEGWQYHLIQQAQDRASNLEHKERIFVTMNAMADRLRQKAGEAGVEDDQVWATVLERMEKADTDTILSENLRDILGGPPSVAGLHDELDKEVTKVADFLRDTVDGYYNALRDLNPDIVDQYIVGYVPHVVDENISAVLGELAGKGGVVGRTEWQAMQAQGNPAGVLLDQMLNAIGKGGRIETQMGASRYINPRSGRMNALTLTDSGAVLFDKDYLNGLREGAGDVIGSGGAVNDVMTSTYFSIGQLNEMLGPLVDRLAKEHNIVLPRNWAKNVFKTNPMDVVFGYVNNLDEVVTSWNLMEALHTAGLAFDHSVAPNVQNMMQSLYRNIMKNTEEVELMPALTPDEDRLARTAMSDWSASSTTHRKTIESMVAGKPSVHLADDQAATMTSRAKALVKMWNKEATPQPGLVRGINADELKQVQNAAPGSHITIGMASTDVGGRFADEAYEGSALGSGEGWRFAFADDTKALINSQNAFDMHRVDVTDAATTARGEFLVSGRFTVESIDNATKTVRLGKQEAILPTPDGMKIQRRLKGFEEALTGAKAPTTKMVKAATTNGFNSVDDAKRVMSVVARGKDAFLSLTRRLDSSKLPTLDEYGIDLPINKAKAGWGMEEDLGTASAHVFRDADGKPLTMLNVEGTPNLPLISFSHLRALSPREQKRAALAVFRKLDDLVESGRIKITYDGLVKMLDQEAMTEEGATLLHNFLRYKLGRVSHEAKEIFTDNPAELVDFELAMDSFRDEVNTLFNEMSAYFDPATGTYVTRAGGKATAEQFAGDDVFIERLSELRKAGQRLSDEHGFDTAVKIFSNIDDYMGLADTPNFVNPRWFALGGPAIEGLTVQPDIGIWLRQLSRNMASIYTPEGVAALKMGTNSVLRWWKAMATISRPSFHVRNLIGGVWNGMIAGVGPQHYAATQAHGITLRNSLREGLDFEDALERLPKNERKYWRAAWDNDVLSGFVSTEFRKLTTAQKKERLAWAKVWDVDNFALTRAGGRVMESIEDFMRMSTFRAWYDPADPSTAKIAKEMVELVHFNYNNLTPLETRLKSFIPFFVWSRRNLPLQLAQVAENPRMIQRYNHMLSAIDDNFGEDNPFPGSDYDSGFAADFGYTVNPGTPFWARVMIDPDLPVRDLVDLPSPSPTAIFEFANNLLGPHVTSMFELNDQRDFGDVNAPAPFNLVLKSLAAVGLYDTTIDGDVRVPYYMRTLMETALPFSREVFDPLSGGPSDPNRQANAGIAPTDNPLESALKTVASTLGRGLGVQLATPAEARSTSARTDQQMDELIENLRLQGKLPASSGSGSVSPDLDDLIANLSR